MRFPRCLLLPFFFALSIKLETFSQASKQLKQQKEDSKGIGDEGGKGKTKKMCVAYTTISKRVLRTYSSHENFLKRLVCMLYYRLYDEVNELQFVGDVFLSLKG